MSLLLAVASARAQWIEAPRTGWVQVGLYHHDTRTGFDENGTVEPFFGEGHAVTTSLYLTATAGVLRGLDVWAQVPAHRLVFDDVASDRERLGLGDPRFYVRIGPSLLGLRPVPVAVRGGVKLPGGDFPVDAEVIPLGEGQRDWELILELGHSFYPRPLYAMLWLGYRWRERNDRVARKPGNEPFGYAAVGGHWQRFVWKLAAEGWRSETPELLGIPVVSARREMLHVLPSIGWSVAGGVVELGGRFPLLGQNLPAGPALYVGYFVSWDLR